VAEAKEEGVEVATLIDHTLITSKTSHTIRRRAIMRVKVMRRLKERDRKKERDLSKMRIVTITSITMLQDPRENV
jgi:uncharacterized UBP type Zn finger protein